jgi:hypothetical protein
MRRFLMVALAIMGLVTSASGESTVVLKSGETLQGDILSDTNDVLRIRAHNASRTLSYQRDISHSEIQSIQTENAAQAAERTDYEALSKFQLNPNQEQSADYCGQVIAAFQKFLIDYPNSDKAPSVQRRLETWQAELKHVSDGQVKFGDKWMTAEDKAPLVEHWQKQMNVQAAQNTLESLKNKLSELQRQRDVLAENLATAQGRLDATQSFQIIGSTPYGGPVVISRDEHQNRSQTRATRALAPPNATSDQLSGPAFYEQQVATGRQMLETQDRTIGDVQQQISRAEQDYKNALAQLNERSLPSPHTSYPPPPPSKEGDRQEGAAQAIIGTWRQDNGDLFIFSSDRTVVAIGNKSQWVRHSTWAVEGNAVVIYWPEGGWDKFLLPLDPRNTINTNKNGDHSIYSKVATP